VTSRRALSRIESHLAQANEFMAVSNELMVAIREEMRLGREQRERAATSQGEQLQLTREVIRRNEIAFADSHEVLAELAVEVRAHTQAIFRMLDRLDGGAAPA
jgi:hypothetical protein